MLLDIGKYPSFIEYSPQLYFYIFSYFFFETLRVQVSFTTETIEVDKRGHCVETPEQNRDIGRHPFDRNVPTPASTAFPDKDGHRMNAHSPQVALEKLFDELLFRLPLDNDSETNHGRPPIMFFLHRSPVVNPSSSHLL